MKKAIDKKQIIDIVVWSLLGVLLLLIVIPLASLAVQKFIQKEPVPKFLGYAYLVVLTPSMTGYADKGDVIIIKEVDADELAVHDVVTYVDPDDGPVTHRITSIDKQTGIIKVKGDTNMDDDPVDLTFDDIQGKVVLVIPKVGVIFEWLTKEGGWIYLLAMVGVVGVGVYFLKSTKSKEETEPTDDKPTDGDNKVEAPAQSTNDDQPKDDHSKDDNEK